MNMHVGSELALELHRQAIERRKRMGMAIAHRSVVVRPVAVVEAPAEPKDERPRDPVSKRYLPRQVPTNARPDLASRLYRLPIRIGRTPGLDSIPGQLLPAKLSALYKVEAFQPINLAPAEKLTPRMVLKSILPGCPAGLSLAVLESRSRIAIVSHARQIAYYIMHVGFGVSFKQTGERFGVDHSTIIYSVRKLEKLISDGVIADPIPYVRPSLSIAAE